MNSFQDMIQAEPARWMLGFALAAIVSIAGRSAGSLTTSGALAATITGGCIVGAGGWWTGLLLVAFFVTSSALSRIHSHAMPGIAQARGHQRDAVQVLANGGIAVTCALVASLVAGPAPWLLAAAAASAGAAADTWATEIGQRSATLPRSVVTWQTVAPGTSGAVSALGTSGAAGGALLIASLAATGSATGLWIDSPAVAVFAIIALSGLAGSLFDSVLGATLQGLWWCQACETFTESRVHRCGTTARLHQGVSFIDNDVVNAIAGAGAGFLALAVGTIWL